MSRWKSEDLDCAACGKQFNDLTGRIRHEAECFPHLPVAEPTGGWVEPEVTGRPWLVLLEDRGWVAWVPGFLKSDPPGFIKAVRAECQEAGMWHRVRFDGGFGLRVVSGILEARGLRFSVVGWQE